MKAAHAGISSAAYGRSGYQEVLFVRKHLLIIAALAAISTALLAQTPAWPPSPDHLTMPLWPNGAPGAQPSAGPEGDLTTVKDPSPAGKPVTRIGNVSNPTLTLYTPKGKNTGAAV